MRPYKSIQKLILALFLGFLLFSCQKEVEPNGDLLGFNYFPLEVGNYLTYQVSIETYNNNIPNLNTYQLQEVVADTFIDLSNRKSYIIERFIRTNENDEWRIDSVWSATQNGRQAIRTENNIDYVKLIFPLEAGLSWNGNSFNNLGEQIYQLKDYRKPIDLNTFSFNRSLKVLQADDSSLVSRTKREETYAEGVGLVRLENVNLRYLSEGEFLGLGIIELGTIYKQEIIDYGRKED